MRQDFKTRLLKDVDRLRNMVKNEDVLGAHQIAQSIARRLRFFQSIHPYIAKMRDLEPGKSFPVPEGDVASVRVYAWKAQKILKGRRFSVKQSKLKPGRFICQRKV